MKKRFKLDRRSREEKLIGLLETVLGKLNRLELRNPDIQNRTDRVEAPLLKFDSLLTSISDDPELGAGRPAVESPTKDRNYGTLKVITFPPDKTYRVRPDRPYGYEFGNLYLPDRG